MGSFIALQWYKRTGYALTGIALSLIVWIGVLGLSESRAVTQVTDSQEYVQELVTLSNQSRATENEGSLSVDEKLSDAAYNKALNMLEENYFAHVSPDGVTPWKWIEDEGYNYIYAGENLAINYDTPEATHDAWMNSPSHRENIMNAEYDEVGIAIARGEIDGEEVTVIVQMFGREVR